MKQLLKQVARLAVVGSGLLITSGYGWEYDDWFGYGIGHGRVEVVTDVLAGVDHMSAGASTDDTYSTVDSVKVMLEAYMYGSDCIGSNPYRAWDTDMEAAVVQINNSCSGGIDYVTARGYHEVHLGWGMDSGETYVAVY